ncbi:DUF3078 domain-containing protein [Mangrovibacterium diazotrophicum]|uniref:DUF3078 family protein n=1 Tax=Mangrovibacterium diazotrophicum TaxID=1261403 RepID=A0A419WAA1_9BACT|nr:DUF3078 domain-containing protein [Mangrovibacterium diazotrophicum]RKD92332.1 Protein of unknown function (DUF3078) [Mangrovibacterium diazotrophicum]
MKKLLLILCLLPLIGVAQEAADSTKVWKSGGNISLNFSQVSLSNWVAGGKSSASGTFLVNLFGNYEKGKVSWENSLDLGYGLLKESDSKLVKSDDKIDFSSKYGYKASGHLYYSALFNFKSQFTDGYKYPDRDNPISRFLAPAYLTLALGLDYKPDDHFSLFFSPLTGKLTVVADDSLSTAGAFGVDPGSKTRWELGAYVKTAVKYEVWKNVTFESKFDIFSNYLDQPQNMDVNWDVTINMKVNDYLSANLITNLIYDNDIKIEDSDGSMGPRVQFKELFGVGLNVKF